MHSTTPETRFLRQVLIGVAFLGLVAIVSLPAARGAGPVGWMPLWLLGMPLAALAALALADLRGRTPQSAMASQVAARKRARPAQARRRMAVRPASPRRRAAEAAPAA